MEGTKRPCTSGKSYETCCQPFHAGASPENALQLMRARFAAYALNMPEYIIKTTHPASPYHHEKVSEWKEGIASFSKHSSFNQLEVLDSKQKKAIATVTFTAHITQSGRDATFTEKSIFERVNGTWFYRSGQLEEGREPNLVTTGQLKMLPLAYYGDPILRKKGAEIEEITKELKALVEEMIETMDATNGIGLAAPQVHHSLRLFITRAPIETEDGEMEAGEVRVFINPKISEPSRELKIQSEGCLSIPGVYGNVKRPVEIVCEYQDLDGNHHKERFSGWDARVIQHEFDHIDGVLFLDRLDKKTSKKVQPLLDNLLKRIMGNFEL